MVFPLLGLAAAGSVLFNLGVRVLGKKLAQETLKKGGEKGLRKLILKTQKSKAPKQKEMFNSSGTVKAGIKKSNATAAKAAKRRTASEKRKATLKAKKDAIKRREAGVAKAKLTRAKNKEAAKKRTASEKIKDNAIVIAAAGGYPLSKKIQEEGRKAKAKAKNKKKGIKPKDPSQKKTGVGSLSPSNYLKRKNKKMGVTGTGNRPYTAEEKARPSKKKKKPSGRPMDNMGGFGLSNRQKYLRRK